MTDVTRRPIMAGNWKMNLNHFEAIALVQKIAFSLPDKYFDKVDVTVIPPFTDLRSVQTLVDGDKLRLTYGAQDLSQHDVGAYTVDGKPRPLAPGIVAALSGWAAKLAVPMPERLAPAA